MKEREKTLLLKEQLYKNRSETRKLLDLWKEQSKILQCGRKVYKNLLLKLTDSGILRSKVIIYLRTVGMLSVSFQTQIQPNFGSFTDN